MNEIKRGTGGDTKLTVLNPVGYPPEIKAKTPRTCNDRAEMVKIEDFVDSFSKLVNATCKELVDNRLFSSRR